MWQDFFDKIYVINLKKRIDRLIEVTEEMAKYNIDFELVTAIEDEEGARGLRDTMVKIFKEAHKNKYESILVFEDDAMWVQSPEIIMDNAINQLPKDWRILYLGCQPSGGFSHSVGGNLLAVRKPYATHAWAISKQGIIDILSFPEMEYPIDNWIVDNINSMGGLYCTNPLLCTQRPGHSDINKNFIDWRPFMDVRFQQKLAEMPR